jgi:hypothetical protein
VRGYLHDDAPGIFARLFPRRTSCAWPTRDSNVIPGENAFFGLGDRSNSAKSLTNFRHP